MFIGKILLDLEGNQLVVVKIGKWWAYACDLSEKNEIQWKTTTRIHLPTYLIDGRYMTSPARAFSAKDRERFEAKMADRVSFGQDEKSE